MATFWDRFDAVPTDTFLLVCAAFLIALGLLERAAKLRGIR